VEASRSEFLWRLVLERVQSLEFDPFRCFIKDEPHKKEKADINRWRLIFASSIVDQVIDHLLFDSQNLSEMDELWNIPAKVGYTPMCGGAQRLAAMFDDPIAMDKSLWDWTMPGFVARVDLEYRRRKVRLSLDSGWYKVAQARYDYCFGKSRVVLSDGTVVEQCSPGLMKSGLVNTISTNCRAMFQLHAVASAALGVERTLLASMGDDTLQEGPCPEGYVEEIQRWGCKVKAVNYGYDFAGFDLKTNENPLAVPQYWTKHTVNLLYCDQDLLPETLDSYQRNYANEPTKLCWLQALLYKVGPKRLFSPESLKSWFASGDETPF